MNTILFFTGVLLLLGIASSKFSARIGMPVLAVPGPRYVGRIGRVERNRLRELQPCQQPWQHGLGIDSLRRRSSYAYGIGACILASGTFTVNGRRTADCSANRSCRQLGSGCSIASRQAVGQHCRIDRCSGRFLRYHP